ncbi:FtsH protease activity modulator HflK [Sphingosinicella terrae]|uniref:FtsH protease activity modulator HflK n=1 Tax=Sphingosinicella terrae TaxID=2172047 RepID=UPI000E0D1C15|nr:FtsH protease activity modulator HflK [Sphingosinicella terrae]
MKRFFWWVRRPGAVLSDNRGGPWGAGGGDGGGGGSGGDGPRNPWGQPPRRRKPGRTADITSLDEFLKKSRARFGGRFPSSQDGRPYWLYGLIAFILLWILLTSVHRISPQERGVVTFFGEYTRTMQPGIGFSWPAPIGRVEKLDVENIRTLTIPGSAGTENLILTGDQNVIDLAYSVRWNIKDPQRFLFQIAEPEQTIQEVAESAMRAVVARVSLDDAIGAGRSDVEQSVEQNMQQLLDDYGAGVRIQGVAINQSVPPAAVNEAFLQVSAAQQQAQSYMNDARAYALQITAKAQGDAAAFEKVYAEYRAAPEVTRRRMYYETMERILSRVDTTIIEAPGVTPYLPLPEIQRRQAQPQPQQGAPAQ